MHTCIERHGCDHWQVFTGCFALPQTEVVLSIFTGLAATGGLAATAMKLHADQAAALGLQAIQSLQLGTT